jgi:dienelactone hydrolase
MHGRRVSGATMDTESPAPLRRGPRRASREPRKVHFKNEDRAPLLLVGAAQDHTVPASLTKAQYKRYERSPAKTDYLEFEGRPHLHMVAPTGRRSPARSTAGSTASSTRRSPPRSRPRKVDGDDPRGRRRFFRDRSGWNTHTWSS